MDKNDGLTLETAKKYKTAFSHLCNGFVTIRNVHENEGLIIFSCSGAWSDGSKFSHHLFTALELSRFTEDSGLE